MQHMSRSFARCFLALTLLYAVMAAPAVTVAGPSTEPVLGHLTDAFSFGFDISPLRPQLVAPVTMPAGQAADTGRPADLDAQAKAVSFDLKLRWPGTEATSALEPYMTLGPALFVVEPDFAGRGAGARLDPSYRVGAKAGAGLNWKLGKAATLFGAYEVTTAGESGLTSLGAKSPSDPTVHGYDFTYGLRFRY